MSGRGLLAGLLLAVAATGLTACTTPRAEEIREELPHFSQDEELSPELQAYLEAGRLEPPLWPADGLVMQGFLGGAYLDSVTLDSGTSEVEIDSDELANAPIIGGGAQFKVFGEDVDLGLEMMFSLGWQSDVVAFSAGGGGATLVLDVDTEFFELFGGPFVNVFLGRDVRVYAAVGPTLQWLDYEQTDDNGDSLDSNGFGIGAYARAGIEVRVLGSSMVGFGVRRTSAEVDLGAGFSDFELDSTQVLFTMTSGF